MKTTTFACPTCGAVLDVNQNTNKLICKYCGNSISISITEKKDENNKSLFSSLVERKYIYYIPHFNGVSDCYDFLLDYGEAVFLYDKNKDILSKDEKDLIMLFFDDAYKYIYECTKANVNTMLRSEADKYHYAFKVLNEAKFEFCNFSELETLTENRMNASVESLKKEESVEHAQRRIGLIIFLVILGIILLPAFIMLIFQWLHIF